MNFFLSELCWRWRRGRRKRENIWGNITLWANTLVFFRLNHIEKCCIYWCPIGKGNGETKDAVSASPTARSGSSRDGAADDQCQQRWENKHGSSVFWPAVASFAYCILWCVVSGRLGATVTFTLKLGISVLNGGNILVQQVCSLIFAEEWITSTSPLIILYSDAENAGLSKGETRCWIFQKLVWTDDVVQVNQPWSFMLNRCFFVSTPISFIFRRILADNMRSKQEKY